MHIYKKIFIKIKSKPNRKMKTIADQIQAQIAFEKALPRIKQGLMNNSCTVIPYEDGLQEMLINAGFDVTYNQYDHDLCVKFKDKGGFWANR